MIFFATSFIFLFQIELINITPHELLPWSDRSHDRMFSRFEVFGRVSILRAVTAADMSARETHPQCYPAIPRTRTILAYSHVFRGHFVDLILMMAFSLCHIPQYNKTPYLCGVFCYAALWNECSDIECCELTLRTRRTTVLCHESRCSIMSTQGEDRRATSRMTTEE